MKHSIRLATLGLLLTSTVATAQYYPYVPYERHSVPANDYARGYNQGAASAYSGMSQGSNMFMGSFATGMSITRPNLVPVPVQPTGPAVLPYALNYTPVPPVGYGVVPQPYGPVYAVPYVR